jgi:hypothetical protein
VVPVRDVQKGSIPRQSPDGKLITGPAGGARPVATVSSWLASSTTMTGPTTRGAP